MKRLLISFSGGETSGRMTKYLLDVNAYSHRWDEIVVVFANTGQENEETLEFVNNCDRHFDFKTVWIEAVQFHGIRKSPSFRVVDFSTASRDGEPFEEAIKKYGIPNSKFKDCTRNLKRNPIENYAKSIGWSVGSYDLAIGIRVDEIDRQSIAASKRRIIYPLIDEYPMTKQQVNDWWSKQKFRLQLKGYQGNCKWCWKKSLRKHLTIISENPQFYDFPRRMEQEYSKIGPEFKKDFSAVGLPENYQRTFFRGNLSTDELFNVYEQKRGQFQPAGDDAAVFDDSLDIGAGCEESCEVYSDEDEEN